VRRSPALAPLSRDHHESLVAAQRLRRATDANVSDARAAFLAFWDRACLHHFRIEEDVLLPALARWGDAYDPLVARTLCDHVAIRAAVASLRSAPQPATDELHGLGDQLAEHVRMEERELFPMIERTVPAAALDALVDRVVQAERSGSAVARPPRA
jgi:hypothetical protein